MLPMSLQRAHEALELAAIIRAGEPYYLNSPKVWQTWLYPLLVRLLLELQRVYTLLWSVAAASALQQRTVLYFVLVSAVPALLLEQCFNEESLWCGFDQPSQQALRWQLRQSDYVRLTLDESKPASELGTWIKIENILD